ncbi:MAG: hypothetical protein K6G61_11245 [Solobacterium sp.]|nr:hypothetical protein [Solobacterium sp.]
MIIEICSEAKADILLSETDGDTALISISSKDEENDPFLHDKRVTQLLALKFNDLTSEFDEEGFPYGRPLPEQEDLKGLKEFMDSLSCDRLLVRCHEGESRSAATAAAVYEYRGREDELRTYRRFRPNRLVYQLACRELGIQRQDLRYEEQETESGFTLLHRNI